MTRAVQLADLPDERPDPRALPIPEDSPVTDAWPPLMRELAAHIGPHAVLQLVDRFGGLDLYVPVEPYGWHVAKVIGADKAAILSRVCGRESLPLPVGDYPLDQARRAPVLARVRAGTLTLTEAAWILRLKRRTVWHFVHKTDEGSGIDPKGLPPLPPRHRQLTFLED